MTYDNKANHTPIDDEVRKSRPKWAAYEMFGSMRSSTDAERKAHATMLDRMSVPIKKGQSIFAIGDLKEPDEEQKDKNSDGTD